MTCADAVGEMQVLQSAVFLCTGWFLVYLYLTVKIDTPRYLDILPIILMSSALAVPMAIMAVALHGTFFVSVSLQIMYICLLWLQRRKVTELMHDIFATELRER